MVCVGARLGAERTPAPERPSHVIFHFLSCLVASRRLYYRTTNRHNAATTRHSYALISYIFSLPFMSTTFLFYHHQFHHRQPRGRRYYTVYTVYTKPRHSAHVYKTALLLVEEGIHPPIDRSTITVSNLLVFPSLLRLLNCPLEKAIFCSHKHSVASKHVQDWIHLASSNKDGAVSRGAMVMTIGRREK